MNNSAAVGYMILAMKSLNYTDKEIKDVEQEMLYKMDMRTEEQAENKYNSF